MVCATRVPRVPPRASPSVDQIIVRRLRARNEEEGIPFCDGGGGGFGVESGPGAVEDVVWFLDCRHDLLLLLRSMDRATAPVFSRGIIV